MWKSRRAVKSYAQGYRIGIWIQVFLVPKLRIFHCIKELCIQVCPSCVYMYMIYYILNIN